MADKTNVTASGSINIGVLIEKFIAGPDGTKFNSLFEKEIKEKLITPLFNKIESKLQSAPIQIGAIKLDDLVQQAVGKIKVEDSSISEFNKSFNESFKTISTGLNDVIKTEEFKKSFSSQLGSKFEELSKSSLDTIFATALKVDKGITGDVFFNKIINPPAELSDKVKKKYEILTSRMLTFLGTTIDKISINEQKISQAHIFNKLLNISPEYSLITRIRIELLTNKLISQLSEAVGGAKFSISDKPIEINKLIIGMLSGAFDLDDGWFGLGIGRSTTKKKYIEVANKLLDNLNKAVDGISFNSSTIDLNNLVNKLLVGTFDLTERGLFNIKSKTEKEYNKLTENLLKRISGEIDTIPLGKEPIDLDINKIIKKLINSFTSADTGLLGTGLFKSNASKSIESLLTLLGIKVKMAVKKIKIKTGEELNIDFKEVINHVFTEIKATSRQSKKAFESLFESVTKQIEAQVKNNIFISDKDPLSTRELIQLLFKDISSKDLLNSFTGISGIVRELFNKIKPNSEEPATTTPGTAPGTVLTNARTVSLTDLTINNLAKKIGVYIDENLDLLTQAEQIDHTNNIVNAIRRYSGGAGGGDTSLLSTAVTFAEGAAGWAAGKSLYGKAKAWWQNRGSAPGNAPSGGASGGTPSRPSSGAPRPSSGAPRPSSGAPTGGGARGGFGGRGGGALGGVATTAGLLELGFWLREKFDKYQSDERDRKYKELQDEMEGRGKFVPKDRAEKSLPPSNSQLPSNISLPNDKKISTRKTEEKLDILNESINSIKTIISSYLQSSDAANNSIANNNRNNNYNTNIMGNESSETQNVQSYNSIRQQRDMFNNFRTVQIT